METGRAFGYHIKNRRDWGSLCSFPICHSNELHLEFQYIVSGNSAFNRRPEELEKTERDLSKERNMTSQGILHISRNTCGSFLHLTEGPEDLEKTERDLSKESNITSQGIQTERFKDEISCLDLVYTAMRSTLRINPATDDLRAQRTEIKNVADRPLTEQKLTRCNV